MCQQLALLRPLAMSALTPLLRDKRTSGVAKAVRSDLSVHGLALNSFVRSQSLIDTRRINARSLRACRSLDA